jgi:hypothetical protein
MPTHETIELACIAVTAVALVTQTIILLVIALGASKAIKSLKNDLDDMRGTVMPTVHNVRDLVERLSPKVERMITDASEITAGFRRQAVAVEEVGGEVLAKVRKETGRLDTMFSSTLDAVDKASNYVTHAVSKPIRQISGLLASLKAIVESLTAPETAYKKPAVYSDSTHDDLREDKDMFV